MDPNERNWTKKYQIGPKSTKIEDYERRIDILEYLQVAWIHYQHVSGRNASYVQLYEYQSFILWNFKLRSILQIFSLSLSVLFVFSPNRQS